jgi:hypothetical protein
VTNDDIKVEIRDSQARWDEMDKAAEERAEAQQVLAERQVAAYESMAELERQRFAKTQEANEDFKRRDAINEARNDRILAAWERIAAALEWGKNIQGPPA